MIESKEICKALSLPHLGNSIQIDAYTTADQPKNNSLLFIKSNSSKNLNKLSKHENSFFILPKDMEDEYSIDKKNSCTFHENPRKIFFEILKIYFSDEANPSIDSSVKISSNTEIGKKVDIGPGTSIIGECIIEDDVTIGSNSLIIGPCRIGSKSSVASGVIIGEESLSISQEGKKNFQNSQLGGVIIGKNSRIGVYSTISKGSIGDTILGENVFIGEYVHIGHNSKIASNSIFTLRSSVCGSVVIEKRCWLGPHSLILNGVRVSEEIKLGANSVLQTNAKKSGTYFGNPAKMLKF